MSYYIDTKIRARIKKYFIFTYFSNVVQIQSIDPSFPESLKNSYLTYL